MSALRAGGLKKCLTSGEYDKLKECPMFESNFVQVTRYGEVANRVTMAIAASSPNLELPDMMILARPVEYPKEECTCENPESKLVPKEELQLTALLPLKFVRIFIHDANWHDLKVSLANGRTFYLRLIAPPDEINHIFGMWIRLLYRLRFYRTDAPLTYQMEYPRYPHRHPSRRST